MGYCNSDESLGAGRARSGETWQDFPDGRCGDLECGLAKRRDKGKGMPKKQGKGKTGPSKTKSGTKKNLGINYAAVHLPVSRACGVKHCFILKVKDPNFSSASDCPLYLDDLSAGDVGMKPPFGRASAECSGRGIPT